MINVKSRNGTVKNKSEIAKNKNEISIKQNRNSSVTPRAARQLFPRGYSLRWAKSEGGTFFRLQVYERVGISLVEVYERVGKSVIQVCERAQKG